MKQVLQRLSENLRFSRNKRDQRMADEIAGNDTRVDQVEKVVIAASEVFTLEVGSVSDSQLELFVYLYTNSIVLLYY